MRALARIAVVLVLTALVPAAAFAQGSITGVVKDASGAVLPGVTVDASSPALIEKTISTLTDNAGLYRIVDLRPGTYTVTFALPGFNTVKREGIEVLGSATLTIPIEMKVGELQETVIVTAASPVVDLQNTKRQTVLQSDVIESLPATRAYGALLNAMPGVTVDNNGLATTPTMTFFSAHGGNTNEGRMAINGMTVAAAFNGGGVSSLTYDTNNLDEASVTVSGGLGENETGGPLMNLVPKSGGNKYAGQAFLNYAGGWSTGDNLNDTLRSQGLTTPPGVINSYDVSGSFGGPIKRDALWFYGSYRKFETDANVAGNFGINQYAGDPSHWDYLRDNTISPRSAQGRNIYAGRVTAQVTPRNRVMFSHEYQRRCEGSTLTPSGSGCRQRDAGWIALGSSTQSPEANTGYYDFPYNVTQATWTSPVTSKLLLDAGYTRFAYHHAGGPGQVTPDGKLDLIPVQEQAGVTGQHPSNYTYRGIANYQDDYGNPNNWRASLTYATGAHNLKAGYQGAYLIADVTTITDSTGLNYRFLGGVPNQVTYRLPNFQTADRTRAAALFVQDTWTRDRLTVQGALRYDHASSFSPAEHNGTTSTSPFNSAPITFPETPGVSSFNDLSPRFGVAYDVFGNGKTAVKFNVGRYLAPATNDTVYTLNNPANRIVNTASRSWTDGNGNYVVDCNFSNPLAQSTPGGDSCGALGGDALNFGKPTTSTNVNPSLLHGWGVRPYDWQWGVNLSQELVPRVSLDVGYNRRWWGNFYVTDNVNLHPSDYQPWTITAPVDPRLPGGGGYPITVYTLTDAAFRRPTVNYQTWETDFGPARTQYWQGVDVTLNARLKDGLTVQAGTTTGRKYTDTCASVLNINNPDPRFCHNVEPYQTTLRGLASYTIPKVDVQVSATVRSQPPVQIAGAPFPGNVGAVPAALGTPVGAVWNVPNTVVQSLLGRPVPGGVSGGNTAVYLTDDGPNRLYATNRRTQLDMRFVKVIRFSGRRADVGLDLNNLLNANYASGPAVPFWDATYAYGVANGGTWLNPTSILAPRFARFNVTFNF